MDKRGNNDINLENINDINLENINVSAVSWFGNKNSYDKKFLKKLCDREIISRIGEKKK